MKKRVQTAQSAALWRRARDSKSFSISSISILIAFFTPLVQVLKEPLVTTACRRAPGDSAATVAPPPAGRRGAYVLSPAVAQQRLHHPWPGVGADPNVLTPPPTATRVRASAAIPAALARSSRAAWLVARRSPPSCVAGGEVQPRLGGLAVPQRTRRAPPRIPPRVAARRWRFPCFPSRAFDQRRHNNGSHVVSRGLPDCAAPACNPSVSFANPFSRRSEPATPPLWCMARWSVPACLAAVGVRSRVEASAQLSLLYMLCL